MTLEFHPDTHSYKVKEKPDLKLISVSKLIDMVKPKFDADYWAEKKAKERKITKEEVLKEWEEIKNKSLEKGTKYHEEYERKLLNDKKAHPPLYTDGVKQAHNLSRLEVGIHPELITYNLRYGIVGTADIIELCEGKFFNIEDHKTNKEIKFESFKKFDPVWKEKVSVKMLPPLQHLEDCNGIHYSIQLSLYAYMLEQFGYKCKSLTINHIIFEGDEVCNIVKYPVEYMKKDVINLLNWYYNKSKNGN